MEGKKLVLLGDERVVERKRSHRRPASVAERKTRGRRWPSVCPLLV